MKKSRRAFWGVLILQVAVLWGVLLVASRDAPPPDEAEFRTERPEATPEDNAYTYFLEATNLLVETTNLPLVSDFRMGQAPASDELRDWVAKNAECLALVKRGTECEICLAPPVETIGTLTPHVNPWLHMGRVLDARARLARLDGRFADAADDLAVGLRFGHLVQKDASSLITYLVGVAIFSSFADSALELARDPAVPPETLVRLAEELETVGPFAGGLAQGIKSEQRIACHVVDGLRDQRSSVASIGWSDLQDGKRLLARLQKFKYCFKPNQTKRNMSAVHRRVIANAPRIYADMVRGAPDEGEMGRFSVLQPNVFGKYLFMILIPGFDKTLESKCGTESVLAGAKLAVACHRFERDRGRFPETLQELVPDFLGEVPRDPYDGAPFRYSAEKGLVWAVGKNLTDDGGSTRVPGVEQAIPASRDRRRAEDFVFELRAAVPSAE